MTEDLGSEFRDDFLPPLLSAPETPFYFVMSGMSYFVEKYSLFRCCQSDFSEVGSITTVRVILKGDRRYLDAPFSRQIQQGKPRKFKGSIIKRFAAGVLDPEHRDDLKIPEHLAGLVGTSIIKLAHISVV